MTRLPNSRRRVVFVSAESLPWIKTGGLGDVAGSLPPALHALGTEIVSVLPLYGRIDREAAGMRLLTTIHVNYLGNDFPTRIFEADYPGESCRALFIENQYYFEREGIYVDPHSGRPYADDDERWFFFQSAVMELLRQTGAIPDILFCNDWHTAMLPALLRIRYSNDQELAGVRTLIGIHNLGYQGIFPASSITKLQMPQELMFSMSPFEYFGHLNCLKAGISFADEIVTVSPTYSEEIRTPELGHGLDGVLRQYEERLTGILNGIDTTAWNPSRDKLIPANYSIGRMQQKADNRAPLLEAFGLQDDGSPILGMVSRLTEQKGLDLIAGCIDRILSRRVKLVILGSGDPHHEAFLRDVARRHSSCMGLQIGYNEELAHLMFAGSDIFLMPSHYEPCGLSQMYAMLYGTPPIVHHTGGLRDTVLAFRDSADEATGFAFDEYQPEELLEAIDVALAAMRKPQTWKRIQRNGMSRDFSWKHAAVEYLQLFESICQRPRPGERPPLMPQLQRQDSDRFYGLPE